MAAIDEEYLSVRHQSFDVPFVFKIPFKNIFESYIEKDPFFIIELSLIYPEVEPDSIPAAVAYEFLEYCGKLYGENKLISDTVYRNSLFNAMSSSRKTAIDNALKQFKSERREATVDRICKRDPRRL